LQITDFGAERSVGSFGDGSTAAMAALAATGGKPSYCAADAHQRLRRGWRVQAMPVAGRIRSGAIAASVRRARQRGGVVTTPQPICRQARGPVPHAAGPGTYSKRPAAGPGSEPARLTARHRRSPPADLGLPECRRCRARLAYRARRARRQEGANQHVGGQRASATRDTKRGCS